MSDAVNSPAHYTDGTIEVIDYIEDKKLDFHLGNAGKYISRAGKKDPTKTIEDLKKAIWYINRKIEIMNKLLLLIGLVALVASCSPRVGVASDYKCMNGCGTHHRTGPRH